MSDTYFDIFKELETAENRVIYTAIEVRHNP